MVQLLVLSQVENLRLNCQSSSYTQHGTSLPTKVFMSPLLLHLNGNEGVKFEFNSIVNASLVMIQSVISLLHMHIMASKPCEPLDMLCLVIDTLLSIFGEQLFRINGRRNIERLVISGNRHQLNSSLKRTVKPFLNSLEVLWFGLGLSFLN